MALADRGAYRQRTSIPGKGADGIGCGWAPVGQRSCVFKWNGVQLHVLRTSDLFIQCKIYYISHNGVGVAVEHSAIDHGHQAWITYPHKLYRF